MKLVASYWVLGIGYWVFVTGCSLRSSIATSKKQQETTQYLITNTQYPPTLKLPRARPATSNLQLATSNQPTRSSPEGYPPCTFYLPALY